MKRATEAMETLATAITRMSKSGYTDQFVADGNRLRASNAEKTYAPEDLAVDEIARFEGASDPADESAVFALRSARDGVLGTYTVAYGPEMDDADTEIVLRLRAQPGA